MNPEANGCAEATIEDHIACLVEYLRRPGARLNVSGDTWSMCWGVGDPLNNVIADRLSPPKMPASGL
jgi:hypothetical protein